MADGWRNPALSPDTSDDTGAGPDRESLPTTPRWVKVVGVALLILVLVIGVLASGIAGGEHGPSRHVSGTADSAPPVARGVQPQ